MAGANSTSGPASFPDEINVPWAEETGTRQFHYDNNNDNPLRDDAITLLELESSRPQDPIRCKLVHVNASDHPRPYELLSCDWQSETRPPHVQISLNGGNFDVPAEVYLALRRVRLEDRPRLLWLDAICINNHKLNKKSREVAAAAAADEKTERRSNVLQPSYLRGIYRNATGLLAWIGDAADESHLVFEHLNKCCREHTHINWCRYRGETLDAYRRLCRRSWFYRAQSAQELALTDSATILCGRDECEWLDFVKCDSFLGPGDYYHPLHGPDPRTHLRQLWALSKSVDPVPLSHVFLVSRHCRAHDPRDKVFSALVLDTEVHFDIPIDYAQDPAHLFRIFTQRAIASSQTLGALHWLGSQEKRVDGLPSWVPDYSVVDPVGTLPRVFSQSATYSIHYPMRLLPGFGFRPDGALAVRGRPVERIARIGKELGAAAAPGGDEFRAVLAQWETLALGLSYKRFPQAVVDAFAETLVGDDSADLLVDTDDAPYIRKPRPPMSADHFHAWYGRRGAGVLEGADATSAEKNGNDADDWRVSRYARRMETTCYGRRFFTTDEGSMGLAPGGAREGDEVVFIPGGTYPFVLRARGANNDGTHELVGDCFLYDFDVFALLHDRNIETREFVLV
ncbi:uncharacterized protein F4812DRAFT_105423 [Daldinia caldariorum]|uniref:uncharacterized protein n=1 Tax=Daldinia caldariorum TaxID=326644 RepID=UPI0020075A8F|nr:uncharacterized protein F4812DRAFT_105423 [Daldinia caldariorum]KAI1465660.1 hypothetical protein F4812DRAFT_105423 [Daldinia caldariorum]